MIIDENAKEIFVSDSVEDITGFTPAETMGHSGFEFLHPDDLDHISKTISKLLETPGGTSGTNTDIGGRTADGYILKP